MALYQHNDHRGNHGALIATIPNIKHAAGVAAGAPVIVKVKYAPRSADRTSSALRNGGLPSHYHVSVNASQPCWTVVRNQTRESFEVVLTPSADSRIAAGTISVAIVG